MRYTQHWQNKLWCLIVVCLLSPAYGGGIDIRKDDVTLNGYAPGAAFLPGEVIELGYIASDYLFSGGDDRYEYYIFTVSQKGSLVDIFVQLSPSFGRDSKVNPMRYQTLFKAPNTPGKYDIGYCRIPEFRKTALGRKQADSSVVLSAKDAASLKKRATNGGHPQFLCSFIVDTATTKDVSPALYLQVNGETPGIKGPIKSGVTSNPLVFSWSLEHAEDSKEVQYRYRLFPDEEDWTEWSAETSTTFFFIKAGQHDLRVESRLKSKLGGMTTLPQAAFSFLLDKPFISRPPDKASVGKKVVYDPPLPSLISTIKGQGKAVVIGVSEFDDKSFTRLKYVEEDVNRMKGVLESQGFDVKSHYGRVTRKEMIASISQLTENANVDDRLIVYISSHGFADKSVKDEGYISCSDCIENESDVNCLSLRNLEDLVKKAARKPVRHILVIVDSCFAGLGVMLKSSSGSNLQKLASSPGLHMLTAGFEDQPAQVDPRLKLSTFTHFLVKGLEGGADYTQDGIITLSELHVFVQYEVAKATGGSQIPMLGRIVGSGEMLFLPYQSPK